MLVGAVVGLMRAVLLIEPDRELDHAGQVGLPAVRARSHLAWTLAELGDFPGARMVAAEAMRVADASNHPYTVCHGSLGLGGTRVRQGEFDAAIGVLARGFATSEHVPLLRPPLAADLGLAYARCGRIVEGLAHLDAAVEGATKMGRFSRLPRATTPTDARISASVTTPDASAAACARSPHSE